MNAKKLITLTAASLLALAPALSQAQSAPDQSMFPNSVNSATPLNASAAGTAGVGLTVVTLLVASQKGTTNTGK